MKSRSREIDCLNNIALTLDRHLNSTDAAVPVKADHTILNTNLATSSLVQSTFSFDTMSTDYTEFACP